MSEKRQQRVFIAFYLTMVGMLLMMSSCGTSQLTQQQIKINYELDILWIEYQYESDSLVNEFYKK
jgi:hypothetical protein